MSSVRTHNLEETGKIAQEFVESITRASGARDKATIVALYGDLGAGKTTFVKAVAKAFGLSGTVTSPTFVIEKIYTLDNQVFDHLIHIDAYRLKSSEELKTLGWEEISQNPKNIIFIEWPENVKDSILSDAVKINFEFVSENVREIKFLDQK